MREYFASEAEYREYSSSYTYVENYIARRQLANGRISFSVVNDMVFEEAKKARQRGQDPSRYLNDIIHSLSMCRMLIDLHMPITEQEKDICISAALWHIIPENILIHDLDVKMNDTYHLDPQIYKIVELMRWDNDFTEAETELYFERIRENPLALLITLADRGHLVERLHRMSSWRAREYIYETRAYFMPMCIYAKENYPRIIAPAAVLMEKLRNMCDMSEILLAKYEQQEKELAAEILALKEDNARLKGLIKGMQSLTQTQE